MKFSVLFFLVINFFEANARETFEFNLGQKINILSDKAFRKTSENEFEAVGNVVISHLKNSIYGEKASINFTNGDSLITGNVRYIAPEMTLYGSKLKYNFLSKEIDIVNAKVLSDNFVITGKKITQPMPNLIIAEDAEYTTCKDCPESWSVFGKEVKITIGKYVKIKHAFIKVNGVIAMYVPYIVFPIKQKRESGILFPFLGFNSEEGFRYQQPFFWAIDDYKDITATPSTFGKRGFGGELQYRQNLGEKTWVEANTLLVNDTIYKPGKTTYELSGGKELRNLSNLEFHSNYKHYLNNHFFISRASDLDTIGDFSFYSKEKLRGTEILSGGFFDSRSSLFSTSFEGYFNRNMLVNNSLNFDDHYVQLLPKIKLSSLPYNFFHSNLPFLKNISFGIETDFTVFKQNKNLNQTYIRNAERLNVSPMLNLQIGNVGPVYFSHQIKLDYQNYSFPSEVEKKFSKEGLIYESQAKFEIERIFGLAYNEEKKIIEDKPATKENNDQIIGSFPTTNLNDNGKMIILNNSYRHSQEYKLKHYYLSDQKIKGSQKFKNQIENENGQFDYLDSIRAKEHSQSIVTAQDSLPINNTLELQWNNRVIKKTAKKFDPYLDGKYLKDNFLYSNIALLEISQGIDLNVVSPDLFNKLTRLYINSSTTIDRWSFSAQEFYYHQKSKHKLTSSASFVDDQYSLGGRFTYHSLDPLNKIKLLGYDFTLNINDLFKFKNNMNFNLESHNINQSFYSILYSPINNCWKLEFNYLKDLKENKLGLVFYLNYNENNFASFNVR